MRTKKILAVMIAAASICSLASCGSGTSGNGDTTTKAPSTAETKAGGDSKETEAATTAADAENLGYEYGKGVTFHSDEPVSYSVMYSDNEAYPYKEDWLLWSKITEMTNVSFDLNIIARADYDDKKSLLINSGESTYIIPKTYDDSPFVTGGAIVPISEWTQYMPNYTAFVEDYKMQDDLKQITQDDGKYYKLPGMWEAPKNEYTWVIRKDVFEAAGVDIAALEKDYTWDTFSEALEKVAAANPGKTVWSDRWKGESAIKVIGNAYDVPAGWGKENGMVYDYDNDTFYFAEVTDDFKNMCKMLNNLVSKGILDSETFSQEDTSAEEKFYNGKSFMIGMNETFYGTYLTKMNETLGEGNYEIYALVPPSAPGKKAYQVENSRLENGVMISQKALDELGEEDFIKMLRFVDWLWYSDEAQAFLKWGVEGETFTEANGVRTLKDDVNQGAINPDAPKKLNADFGFSNGVFMYGGTVANRVSMLSPELQDYYARIGDARAIRPLKPAVALTEEEKETLNLIQTPLMDYVNTSMLQFITGQKDIDAEWDTYVANCAANNYESYVEQYNAAYQRSK